MDREVVAQGYYTGKKESEQGSFQNLLEKTETSAQKITADALHLNPKTTEKIAKAGGIFLIGLKANQKKLLADMMGYVEHLKPVDQEVTFDKGYGHIEKREYKHYAISGQYVDSRWQTSGFKSLFKVKRWRFDLAGVSNLAKYLILFLTKALIKRRTIFWLCGGISQ